MAKHILNVIPAMILLCSAPTRAAEEQSSVSTALGANARYEIVQSELVARATFRLDRVCGYVSQMVTGEDNRELWRPTLIQNKPPCTADGRIRYQLFSSGLMVRQTYLMNTDNGVTWRLVADTGSNLFWEKLP